MTDTVAFLKALTPESKASLGAPIIKIHCYPFRVGRESRERAASFFANSRRQADSAVTNELYLLDTGKALNVSREHFQIEKRNDAFVLVDRNSMCGTLVEGEVIGKGRNGGEKRLYDGDVIIVGTSESKQIFKFIVQTSS